MPDSAILQYLADQGLGTVLAFLMFLFYRHDARRNLEAVTETASAHMQMGRDLGAAMERTANLLNAQATILLRIERHMEVANICPVSHVTAAEVQRMVDDAPGPRRRRMDRVIDDVRHRIAEDVAVRSKDQEQP